MIAQIIYPRNKWNNHNIEFYCCVYNYISAGGGQIWLQIIYWYSPNYTIMIIIQGIDIHSYLLRVFYSPTSAMVGLKHWVWKEARAHIEEPFGEDIYKLTIGTDKVN